MVVKSVHIRNFRSILDEELVCDRLTALVGRNGTGKSAFLQAIELFYDPAGRVSSEDFYAEETGQDIEIAVTFSDLNAEEKRLFARYLDGDELTVARVFSLSPGAKLGTYHGMRLQNADFNEARTAGGKREIVKEYKRLRENSRYSGLPSVKTGDEALKALSQWETENPEMCSRQRDDGQFFGFTEVGQGYLGRYTRFIRIPAVRDASEDATEGKGSCVTEIMDLVVRSVLARRKDLATFKEETQAKYREIMDPTKLTELSDLQTQLSGTLKYYAPQASVLLRWAGLVDINVPLPKSEVRLAEDGYESSVERTGHGLQRAFILTMLQHLIAARELEGTTAGGSNSESEILQPEDIHLPNLVLAIEEPELYQHPSRQRHMASILLRLAEGVIPGVAEQTQVVYSTHAPLFVGLERFDQIKLLRKIDGATGKPRVTKVAKADLDGLAEALWVLDGQRGTKYTAGTLRPRMQAVMTPWMNEGFFADAVVLVEGECDRAALLAVGGLMGHDLEAAGICVVPCMSKNNLDRPGLVFRALNIRVYVVWDNDKGASNPNPSENRRLLKLVGAPEEDWPAGVWDSHACLDCNLECTLRTEITPRVFDTLLDHARNEFRMKKDQALKNPFVLRRVIEDAARQGHTSATLTSIVERVVRLGQAGHG